MKNRNKKILVSIVLVILVVGAGFYFAKSKNATSDPQQALAERYLKDMQSGNVKDLLLIRESSNTDITPTQQAQQDINAFKDYSISDGYTYHQQYPGNSSSERQYGYRIDHNKYEAVIMVKESSGLNKVTGYAIVAGPTSN